ncbi:MAG: hypothetical protein C0424_10455 [Sphingobacteriaceae bacterium]|nr:hypothetical protein [Sphingobacteriaceae bacterium]
MTTPKVDTYPRVSTILYSCNMGEGLILNEGDPKPWRLEKITVAGIELVPGEPSDMAGYFRHPLVYCGLINEKHMVFYIGSTSDLFGCKYYYQVVMKVDETRLFSMFTFNAGRDFNFIRGRWK